MQPASDTPPEAREIELAAFAHASSATLDAKISAPGGISLICLGCHDGTLALNTSCDKAGARPTSTTRITNFRSGHPFSFAFDKALVEKDGSLNDPDLTRIPRLGSKTIQQALLFDGKIECSTCHDVHKQRGTSASDKYCLVLPTERGELCLTCHRK